ncbi:MAG TPA: sulfotransferase [Phycisphaerae bacterium]|nr:sulfotransferase [Phycisphaerae bacterium]
MLHTLFDQAIHEHRAGRHQQAEALYREILARDPASAPALHHLGLLAHQHGDHARAAELIRQSLALAPAADAWNNLGIVLLALGRTQEAIAALELALEMYPNLAVTRLELARAHYNFGAAAAAHGDLKPAITHFRRALQLDPGTAQFWNALGTALNFQGRFEEGVASLRHALAIMPEAKYYLGLAASGRHVGGAVEIAALLALLENPALPLDDRAAAEFALGRLCDEAGKFDDAFQHFSAGNRLVRESRAAAGLRFDAERLSRSVDQMIAAFTPEFFAARRTWGNDSQTPVFIVGMPRSGTSLVEQIAASHPAVFGAGELQVVDHLPLALAPPHTWTAENISTCAREYLAKIHELSGGHAERVTDKMPANIFLLGLIAALFPNARVIFCRRDGRDNCLSCYFQRFDQANILYTYDLADCAFQYLETERLAAHWRRVLPLRMLDVHYEKLVTDQETESRRLLQFLGLPWDPACLRFHETERTILTASFWQVRQPMYTRSIGRWRHYEPHLARLCEVLGG